MKSLLVIASLLSVCMFATAAESSIDDLPCDSLIGYRPGGSTLKEASGSFSTELQIFMNSCQVQKIVKSDRSSFYIRSYTQKDSKEILQYSKFLIPKSDKEPKEFECLLVKSTKYDGLSDNATVKFKNFCKDKSAPKKAAANNPNKYVCQTGWIDCMPGDSDANDKYCTNEFIQWSKDNCGGEPNIAY